MAAADVAAWVVAAAVVAAAVVADYNKSRIININNNSSCITVVTVINLNNTLNKYTYLQE